jgi:hypothetical protein
MQEGLPQHAFGVNSAGCLYSQNDSCERLYPKVMQGIVVAYTYAFNLATTDVISMVAWLNCVVCIFAAPRPFLSH